MFKKEEIKEGYLLRCIDNNTKEFFNMTVISVKLNAVGVCLSSIAAGYPIETDDTLACVCPGSHYFPLSRLNEDLVHARGYYTVQSIYGRTFARFAMDNTTESRELLWIREEPKQPKKMTLDEIKDALGYEIEII